MTLNFRLFFVFVMAFILMIFPLPHLMMGFRPPVILLLVLYIQYFLPQYFNTTALLLIGLCMDVLLSTVIGEHAFALLLTTWIASGKSRRFAFFSMGQQMMLISILCFIYQLIIFLIDAFLGYHHGIWSMAGAAFLSMLAWPWIRIFADSALLMRRV